MRHANFQGVECWRSYRLTPSLFLQLFLMQMCKKYLRKVFFIVSFVKEKYSRFINTIKKPKGLKQTSFDFSDNFSKLPLPCREFMGHKNSIIGAKMKVFCECCFVLIIMMQA